MEKIVSIVGLGLTCSIGSNIEEIIASFKDNKRGIATSRHLNSTLELPVGEVILSDKELSEQLNLNDEIPRTTLLGLKASRAAIGDISFDLHKYKNGLISATTVGGMNFTEEYFKKYLSNLQKGEVSSLRYHECGKTTQFIANDLGINSLVTTINTACSSSVNSIIYGSRLIKNNMLDIAIVGGTDALCSFTLNGFNSLRIYDSKACKPFDSDRAGLNLGEGAAFMVLASQRVVENENLEPICSISGYGVSSDAYHQTASSSEGIGSYKSMQQALKSAKLKSSEIDYINLHGTGTQNNDLSEGRAVSRLFNDLPALSSTKGFTGHTLGASGAIESVFSLISIKENAFLPNVGFIKKMPELDILPQNDFVIGKNVDHVLCNSFGFGGNCSSIIYSSN